MAKQTWVNVSGTWRKVKSTWINANNAWKKDVMPKGVISGGYKEFMQYILTNITGQTIEIPYTTHDLRFVTSNLMDVDDNNYVYVGFGGSSENFMKVDKDFNQVWLASPSGTNYSLKNLVIVNEKIMMYFITSSNQHKFYVTDLNGTELFNKANVLSMAYVDTTYANNIVIHKQGVSEKNNWILIQYTDRKDGNKIKVAKFSLDTYTVEWTLTNPFGSGISFKKVVVDENDRIFIVGLNSTLNTIFLKEFNANNQTFIDMPITADYTITGTILNTVAGGGQINVFASGGAGIGALLTFDYNGNLLWLKNLGLSNDRGDMDVDNDGNLFISHNTSSTFYIRKYDKSGKIIWTYSKNLGAIKIIHNLAVEKNTQYVYGLGISLFVSIMQY